MWRVAYASACSAARYQRARSSSSSRSVQPGYAAAQRRIGEWRAIAEHVRLQVQVVGELLHRRAAPSRSVRRASSAANGVRGGVERRMRSQCVIEERAGRRDAGLEQPLVRAAGRRSTGPTRRHRRAGRRRGEMARGRTGDDGDSSRDRRGVPRRAERAERARVRVDQRRCTRRCPARDRGLPRRRSVSTPSRSPGTRTRDPMRNESVLVRSPRPICVEVRRIPAALVAEVGPLAHRRAQRARRRCRSRATSGSRRDRTSARCAATCRGSSRFSQRSFGVSISGEIDSADVIEHGVTGRIDRGRIVDGAVIHPDDDVALVARRRR